MRRSKYGNRKAVIDGITFDSRKEANRFLELRMLERAGKINALERQVKYVLIPTQRESSSEIYTKGAHKGELKPGKVLEKECSYIADFSYIQDGAYVVEDTKGVRTEAYKIKRKLMLERYGIKVREV